MLVLVELVLALVLVELVLAPVLAPVPVLVLEPVLVPEHKLPSRLAPLTRPLDTTTFS